MISFNDWYFDLFESGNGSCLNQQEIAQEAWDYQQSKVDDLFKLVAYDTKFQAEQFNKIDELKKRLDAVMKIVSTKRQKCWSTSIEAANVLYELEQELEQALKGGLHETY